MPRNLFKVTVVQHWLYDCWVGPEEMKRMPNSTLLERLRESELLSAEQLDELSRRKEARETDPRSLAKCVLERGWLTRFQINQVAAGRGRELQIAQYVLLDRLGEGGMGQVFKARHAHMGRVVALKLMRKEKLSSATAVERFFRTLREDLLQALPGYKGPDVHSRGLNPEQDAFFFLDELEAIVREWVAAVYHHRPHTSLIDSHLPKLRMSPAMMFEHGVAATSLKNLRESAGVSGSQLTHYFQDKRDLTRQVVSARHNEVMAFVDNHGGF